jgi:hypothetical protein
MGAITIVLVPQVDLGIALGDLKVTLIKIPSHMMILNEKKKTKKWS